MLCKETAVQETKLKSEAIFFIQDNQEIKTKNIKDFIGKYPLNVQWTKKAPIDMCPVG